MQLNKQTDYALRVLMYLALLDCDRLVTIDEIVERFSIARNHLTKIITKLNKLKLIKTYRGINGGLELNPATLTTTIDQIILCFEDTKQVVNCHHLNCPLTGLCNLKCVLDEASSSFRKVLANYTLNDMLPKDASTQNKINIALDYFSIPEKANNIEKLS